MKGILKGVILQKAIGNGSFFVLGQNFTKGQNLKYFLPYKKHCYH